MQTEPIFHFRAGRTPLLVSMPHVGTYLPPQIAARMTALARSVPDTDWHLAQLYDFLDALGASVLIATHSRYVIDLNRPPDNANLYPGQDTTGLCPIDTFSKAPIYQPQMAPNDTEISQRVHTYWQPYHQQLQTHLQQLRDQHGVALLWDAHSIASVVPRFFSGRLTDFNLGTANGASCGSGIGEALRQIAESAPGYSAALNGRFKGGYITRTYGQPAQGIHAVQLELSEITYMNEDAPFAFRTDRATQVRPYLQAMLARFLACAKSLPAHQASAAPNGQHAHDPRKG